MKLFSFVDVNVLFSLLVDITEPCAKAKIYVKTKNLKQNNKETKKGNRNRKRISNEQITHYERNTAYTQEEARSNETRN